MRERLCPECKQDSLDRDEVDVGVGVIRGPSWCLACGWGEETGTDESGLVAAVDDALADALDDDALRGEVQ